MIKELYKFTEVKRDGSTETVINVTTLTSSKPKEIYETLTYAPTTMSSSNKEAKSEVSKSNLKVYFSLDNEFAQSWFENEDSILQFELIEKDGDDYTTAWQGRLLNVEIVGNHKILNFESIFTSLRNYGLTRVFQRSCPVFLFDNNCGLNKDDFEETGIISSVTGVTLTIPEAAAFDDDYFTYGSISDGSGNSRMIISHIGNQITISRTSVTLLASVAVSIYPGCSKSREVCHSKFNNVINFKAFPYMPVQDIFDKIVIV